MRTSSKAIIFVVFNIVIGFLATFALAKPSRLKFQFKEAKSEEFETLILGESHGSSGLNPFILSEKTGMETYNISTGGMAVIDFSYVVEELNVTNHYKRVIVDVDATYWVSNHRGNACNDNNLLYRLTGTRKLDYLINVLWNDNYNDTLFDYIPIISTVKRIPKAITAKLNADYWLVNENGLNNVLDALTSNTAKYIGRGFFYGTDKSGEEWNTWIFDESSVYEENIKGFEKLFNYCKKNNIELILIQSAATPYRLKTENFDDVHDYFSKLCESYDVPFYDLSYLKKGYLDRTDDDYKDIDGHMMGELADRHSEVLADILNADDKSVFFYDDYDDVLNSLN